MWYKIYSLIQLFGLLILEQVNCFDQIPNLVPSLFGWHRIVLLVDLELSLNFVLALIQLVLNFLNDVQLRVKRQLSIPTVGPWFKNSPRWSDSLWFYGTPVDGLLFLPLLIQMIGLKVPSTGRHGKQVDSIMQIIILRFFERMGRGVFWDLRKVNLFILSWLSSTSNLFSHFLRKRCALNSMIILPSLSCLLSYTACHHVWVGSQMFNLDLRDGSFVTPTVVEFKHVLILGDGSSPVILIIYMTVTVDTTTVSFGLLFNRGCRLKVLAKLQTFDKKWLPLSLLFDLGRLFSVAEKGSFWVFLAVKGVLLFDIITDSDDSIFYLDIVSVITFEFFSELVQVCMILWSLRYVSFSPL